MKGLSLLNLFFLWGVFEGGSSSVSIGTYFYKELGCTEKNDGKIKQYECPDFHPKNGSCRFKNRILNSGENVDLEHLKGSCHAACHCGLHGYINCAHIDCPFDWSRWANLEGCSHYRSTLDRCCPVEWVCGPHASCEIEGNTYKEGNKVYLKNKCEVCLCDKGFELKAPFCRPRKCYDQAHSSKIISNYGAPAFTKADNCCPYTWLSDEGQEIVKRNANTPSDTGLSCKFGNRTVNLGYGFKTKETPYGREVQFTCECSIPPLVICREEA